MYAHLVLLGDSIFDNAAYVSNGPAVIEHLQRLLAGKANATLIAKDGDVANDVFKQLERIPGDASHLVLSVGGNDALGAIPAMSLPVETVQDAMIIMAGIRDEFSRTYRNMLERIVSLGRPIAVCTVYEDIPGLTKDLKTALAIFNDAIVREALATRVKIIDLRQICSEADDYSSISPIEPSEIGGQKIARAIYEWLMDSQK